MRPRCSVFIATSLDGFIARPDGNIDWLSVVEEAGEDYGYRAFFDSVDTVVVGRKTYNVVSGFEAWPYAGKRVVVLTHEAPTPKHDEDFFSGPPDTLVDTLTARGASRIYVDGGNVIRQFLAAGLITDMTISIVPVLLGDGIPLFGSGKSGDIGLDLVESRTFPSGLVQVTYRVRG